MESADVEHKVASGDAGNTEESGALGDDSLERSIEELNVDEYSRDAELDAIFESVGGNEWRCWTKHWEGGVNLS